jgi:26S proteasome regulatory subunit N11
MDLQAMLAQA